MHACAGSVANRASAARGPALMIASAAACALGIALGISLGLSHRPGQLAAAGAAALMATAFAIISPRWAVVAIVFLLVGHGTGAVPGAAGNEAVLGSVVVLTVATVVRQITGAAVARFPPEWRILAVYAGALTVVALLTGDQGPASRQLSEFLSFAALIVLMLVWIDSALWYRRVAWAITSALGLLALLAVVQQLTRTYDSDFGGLARVDLDAGAYRSAGPVSANFFGQMLAVGVVLAAYIALSARRVQERVLALASAFVGLVALVYTLSRGAMVGLSVALIVALALRRVGPRVIVLTVVLVAAGVLALPADVRDRVGALASLARSDIDDDPSFRGRLGENRAALEMWRDHLIAGVGPGSFERNYLRYSTAIGVDGRPEERSAHSLYLESLAETGLLGTIPFLVVIAMALRRPWSARKRLPGDQAVLAEGNLVAVIAFLVTAMTLQATFTRTMWILIGLAFVAGRVAEQEAT